MMKPRVVHASIFSRRLSGSVEIAEVRPQRAVVALGGDVVQQQEIAHALEVEAHAPVVFIGVGLRKILVWKQLDELGDAFLDQVDRRRFERLEKSGGKADGDHILVPEEAAPAGLEVQLVRGRERGPFEVAEQEFAWPHRRK